MLELLTDIKVSYILQSRLLQILPIAKQKHIEFFETFSSPKNVLQIQRSKERGTYARVFQYIKIS